MEPITASAIATLAFTKAFEKTIEKFTEAALVKMDELRKKIWDKLRGNPEAETALVAAEKSSKRDLDRTYARCERKPYSCVAVIHVDAHRLPVGYYRYFR